MNVTRHYYSTWIEAAERGEIEWETVSMLIEAFELGITECVEELITTNKTPNQISEEAISIKNDTFQYLKNKGKLISYPPSTPNNKPRIEEIEKQLRSTINFNSRRLRSEIKKSI